MSSLIYLIVILVTLIVFFIYLNSGAGKKAHYFHSDFAKDYGLSLRAVNGYININNPFRGIFIDGGAGSGKSESIIKPIILEAVNKNYCGILYDFKDPELSLYLASAMIKNKSKITRRRISFTDVSSSARCNPLAPKYVLTLSHAEEYATVIINNLVPESITKADFWNRSAIAILQSSIWFFREHHPHKCDLPHITNFLQSSHHEVIKTLMKDDTCKRLISSIVTAYEQQAEGQLAGTFSTLQLALNKINTPEVAYILGKDDVNLDINNPEDPTFLSIGNNPTLQDSFSPVISLIITVCLRMMNNAGKHHSIVILDEAPTLYIPKLENVPATARSNKVSVVFCCQDLAQVVDRYGKGKKDILISNLANQFWGRVSNADTSDYMIKLAGKDYVWIESHSSSSSSNSSSSSTSQSQQHRENLTIQQIQNFRQGNFLCVLVEREVAHISKRYKKQHPKQLKNVFIQLFNPEYLESKDQYSGFNKEFNPDTNGYMKQVRSEVEHLLTLDIGKQATISNDVSQLVDLINPTQPEPLDISKAPSLDLNSETAKDLSDSLQKEGKKYDEKTMNTPDDIATSKNKKSKRGI